MAKQLQLWRINLLVKTQHNRQHSCQLHGLCPISGTLSLLKVRYYASFDNVCLVGQKIWKWNWKSTFVEALHSTMGTDVVTKLQDKKVFKCTKVEKGTYRHTFRNINRNYSYSCIDVFSQLLFIIRKTVTFPPLFIFLLPSCLPSAVACLLILEIFSYFWLLLMTSGLYLQLCLFQINLQDSVSSLDLLPVVLILLHVGPFSLSTAMTFLSAWFASSVISSFPVLLVLLVSAFLSWIVLIWVFTLILLYYGLSFLFWGGLVFHFTF